MQAGMKMYFNVISAKTIPISENNTKVKWASTQMRCTGEAEQQQWKGGNFLYIEEMGQRHQMSSFCTIFLKSWMAYFGNSTIS